MSSGESQREFEHALAACGVTPGSLSPAAREDLEVCGYHVFEDLLDPAWLAELRDLVAACAEGAGERGTRHLNLLDEHQPALDRVLTEPHMLSATQYLLGRPFRWNSLSCRDPQPGFGAQGLHTDWPARAPGEPAWVVTVIWLLDDFTDKNGATRLVPGTHTRPMGPPKDWRQPGRRHADELLVTAPAGSALVFSGHLWHSGTLNESRGSRRVLQLGLVAREQASMPLLEHPDPLRLSPAGLVLLGLED